MRIQVIDHQQGTSCRICAVGRAGRFPLLDFIETCHRDHPRELIRLQALLDRFAENGRIFDSTKVNSLGEGLFEFKTPGGLRVTWFWDAGRCVICGHCFIKKSQKTPKQELDSARFWKEHYFAAKSTGNLHEINHDPLP